MGCDLYIWNVYTEHLITRDGNFNTYCYLVLYVSSSFNKMYDFEKYKTYNFIFRKKMSVLFERF